MRGAALALLAIAVAIVSIRWGSFVAGGSDSYCYVYQAERWADTLRGGSLQIADALALEAPWPDAPLTFAPVGHIPSPTVRGALAPICPAGLSIVMAPVVAIGGPRAAFVPLPLLGALLVLATYFVGARFGARIGMAAALVTAASPIVLYQVVQPMSDVAAAAFWMLAVAGATGTKPRHVMWGGVATSAAILVRPNLLPLGLVIGVYVLFRPERTWRQRARAAITYASASAVGCLAVAVIQDAFFGSPLSSGYGSLASLFSMTHVAPNAERYASWLWSSHTPAIVLAILAPVLLPGPLSALFIAMFAVNVAVYLPYTVFEDWSFLRFLLPTIPLVLILAVAVVDAICRRWAGMRDTQIVLAVAAGVLAAVFIREANARQAFRLHTLESRFERAGVFAGDRLPPNAIVVTRWESGSVRFYGHRPTLVWDALDPAWLDRAFEWLRGRGYEPFLLFERSEEPEFRRRFAGSPLGALDWPPAYEIGGQVRIYRPRDQALYRQGAAPPTEYSR